MESEPRRDAGGGRQLIISLVERPAPRGWLVHAMGTVRVHPALVFLFIDLEPARIGGWSWSFAWSGVPPVTGPGSADQTAGNDDRVGEVEEGVDHGRAALVTAV